MLDISLQIGTPELTCIFFVKLGWRLTTSITPEMSVRAPHPGNDPGVPCSMVREAAVLLR